MGSFKFHPKYKMFILNNMYDKCWKWLAFTGEALVGTFKKKNIDAENATL